MAHYKKAHPEANLKEILAHLDVPYRDQVTEGVLRGLIARSPRTDQGTNRINSKARLVSSPVRYRTRPGAQGGGRGRRFDRVIAELTGLRRRREDLDEQIGRLEGELRERLHRDLGSAYVEQILGMSAGGT